MADEAIDPRYAAQFQRGFDPAVHAALPVSAPPSASTREAPVRLPGGPPASAPRIGVPPPRVEPEISGTSPELPALPLPADEPELRSPVTEWALLIAGVVLLVGSVAVFWQSMTDLRLYMGSAYDPALEAFLTVRNSLSGPLLVGAVFAVSAWLVLRALRRAR